MKLKVQQVGQAGEHFVAAELHRRGAYAVTELFRQAAAVADESLSEFLVEGGRERAARLLADRTQFVLSDKDWAAFSEALDRPAQADPALVELFRRSRPA